MKDPYKQAEKVNRKIEKLVEKHPINGENARSWLLFSRTVGTAIEIIEKTAKDLVLKEGV